MFPEASSPKFAEFLRFVASRYGLPVRGFLPPDRVLVAARAAREELRVFSRRGGGRIEVLELLAASSGDAVRPSELVTVRGFRVRLDYRDGTDTESSSICVLVQCPEQLIAMVAGQVAYLWNGAERFQLGEFDADGKAIGTLPAGIAVSVADFTSGRVKLEAPHVPPHD